MCRRWLTGGVSGHHLAERVDVRWALAEAVRLGVPLPLVRRVLWTALAKLLLGPLAEPVRAGDAASSAHAKQVCVDASTFTASYCDRLARMYQA